MVGHDVDSLDNIGVLQGGSNAKLCGDLFLIFTLSLTRTFRPKLLDSKDATAVLAASLDKTNGSAGTASKNTTPFAVFFGEVCLGSILKRDDGTAWGGGARTLSYFETVCRAVTGHRLLLLLRALVGDARVRAVLRAGGGWCSGCSVLALFDGTFLIVPADKRRKLKVLGGSTGKDGPAIWRRVCGGIGGVGLSSRTRFRVGRRRDRSAV